MWMLAERLAAVPLLLLFLVLAGCLADHLLSRTKEPRSTLASAAGHARAIWERTVMGSGLLVAVLFAAAATGLYQPRILVGLTLMITVLGGLVLAAELRTLPALSMGPSSQTKNLRWPQRLVALSVTLLLLCLWLQSIRPDVSHDADVYHLTLPKLFLEHGGFFSVPLNVYSHWPLATELLFGLAIAVHDYIFAKQLHFVFGLLILLTLLDSLKAGPAASNSSRYTAEAFLTWPGILAATLFLANPVVLFEIRVAYIDLALTFFFLTAFLTADRLLTDHKGLETRDRRRQLLLLGVACGLVCATKLSGALGALSILLVYWTASFRHRSARDTIMEARWIVLPILLLAAPWPIKSWWFTGNPTYPLLFKFFGGPDWSDALSAQHAAWQSSIGMGRTLVDYLLLPLRVITEGDQGYDHFDGRLHLAWLFFLPLSIWSAIKDPTQRRVLGTSAIYFTMWAATSQQMRLLVPLLALLAFSGARALRGVQLPLHKAPRAVVPATAALVMAALCFVAAAPNLRQTPQLARDLAFLGYRAKEAVIHPVYRTIADLPATSRLLLLNTNRGFFINRPYLADAFFEASQVQHLFGTATTAQDARAILQHRNITHILFERQPTGLPYPAALLTLLQDPGLAHLTYESPDKRYAILELAPRRP